jgi:hypothetical protein
MARSPLTDTSDDLIQDSGSVLWSFVKGEQLEFPITLNFVEDVTAGYTYEAVIVEALNVSEQTSKPLTIKPSGVQTILNVRVPTKRGTWDAAQAYNREDVVLYAGIYYKLLKGAARTNSTPPSSDSLWQVTTLSKIYLQFPSTLGSTWQIAPIVGSAVYGFFELRVTEPTDNIFRRTWKPVRGMVELLFSPTDIVPDV